MSEKIESLLNRAKLNEDESSISSAEKTFSGDGEAARVFSILKTKLLDIEEWNEHGMLSSYDLFDENGQPLESKKISVGVNARISLKGSGKYDWVRATDIFEAENEFIVTVKPTFDPTAENVDKTVISHFFTDDSTNNFCLLKEDETVKFLVIGLDEKLNTSETSGALETARNAAVKLGSYFGVQKSEWEKFCTGFINCAADEISGGKSH